MTPAEPVTTTFREGDKVVLVEGTDQGILDVGDQEEPAVQMTADSDRAATGDRTKEVL